MFGVAVLIRLFKRRLQRYSNDATFAVETEFNDGLVRKAEFQGLALLRFPAKKALAVFFANFRNRVAEAYAALGTDRREGQFPGDRGGDDGFVPPALVVELPRGLNG